MKAKQNLKPIIVFLGASMLGFGLLFLKLEADQDSPETSLGNHVRLLKKNRSHPTRTSAQTRSGSRLGVRAEKSNGPRHAHGRSLGAAAKALRSTPSDGTEIAFQTDSGRIDRGEIESLFAQPELPGEKFIAGDDSEDWLEIESLSSPGEYYGSIKKCKDEHPPIEPCGWSTTVILGKQAEGSPSSVEALRVTMHDGGRTENCSRLARCVERDRWSRSTTLEINAKNISIAYETIVTGSTHEFSRSNVQEREQELSELMESLSRCKVSEQNALEGEIKGKIDPLNRRLIQRKCHSLREMIDFYTREIGQL